MKSDRLTFLLHPSTELWWKQREQCRQCEHLFEYGGSGGETVMRCEASDVIYCIDARLEGAPCGPDARLFKTYVK